MSIKFKKRLTLGFTSYVISVAEARKLCKQASCDLPSPGCRRLLYAGHGNNANEIELGHATYEEYAGDYELILGHDASLHGLGITLQENES
jgi:hypothetical protein